jgi:hypothetical protein
MIINARCLIVSLYPVKFVKGYLDGRIFQKKLAWVTVFSFWFAERHSASDIVHQASDQSTLFRSQEAISSST